MSKAASLMLLVLVLVTGCTIGDGSFDGGGFEDDDGGVPQAGTGGAGTGGGADVDGATPGADGGDQPVAGGGAGGTGGAGVGGSGGAGADPMIEVLAARLAASTCEALADCVGDPDLLADLLGGRDCAEVTEGDLRNGELSAVPDAIEAGRVAFDASELDDCTDNVAALGCDVRSRRWPASCELLLLGTVELGGDCGIDQECAGDAYCAITDTCPGSCTALLTADETCTDGDDDQCADGLVCAAATDSCTSLGDNGDGCGAGMPPCAPGRVCFDDGGGAQCTNVAVLYFRALDESCFPGAANCDPGVSVCGDVELCEPGLVCESASSGGVCRPATTERGGDCKRAVPNQCPLEQVCDAVTPGETGSCIDRPSAGEPCIDRSPRCAPGHICVEDTCLELVDNGASCGFDEECLGGTCGEGGVCIGPALCAE